jgi:uncharacterized protein YyaL (SSP411 family)
VIYLSQIYMTYVQATQGGGGWPMSCFLTPSLEPFFAGAAAASRGRLQGSRWFDTHSSPPVLSRLQPGCLCCTAAACLSRHLLPPAPLPSLCPTCTGTYFPPADSFGRPGFRTVLRRIADVWRQQKEDIKKSSKESMARLAEAMAPEVGKEVHAQLCLCVGRGGGGI